MSRRLTDTRQGRAAPTLSLRLTEAMAAAVERVRTELVAASPAGLSVSSSDAARVLLGEALAARAVPAAPVAPPRPLSPAVRAREQSRDGAVTHTAAGGQLSLLTRTANDGAQHRPHRATNTASAAENSPASAEVLAALKPRLKAAIASSSAKAIARGAGVDAASLTRWLSGARPGVSVGTARKLSAYLASRGG